MRFRMFTWRKKSRSLNRLNLNLASCSKNSGSMIRYFYYKTVCRLIGKCLFLLAGFFFKPVLAIFAKMKLPDFFLWIDALFTAMRTLSHCFECSSVDALDPMRIHYEFLYVDSGVVVCVTSSLSTRLRSISSTSIFIPAHSKRSPARGILPRWVMTNPPTV